VDVDPVRAEELGRPDKIGHGLLHLHADRGRTRRPRQNRSGEDLPRRLRRPTPVASSLCRG
jgi:hypothetical protein